MITRTRTIWVCILTATIVLAAAVFMPARQPVSAAVGSNQPYYGIAVVDGDSNEWNLTDDFFAPMYLAAKLGNPILGNVYVRYNCLTETMYVLVLSIDGVDTLVQPQDAYVKLGNSTLLVDGNDEGNPGLPTFAWVNLRDNNTRADGWEAAFSLAPASYSNFNVHNQVYWGGMGQTSAVDGRGIPIDLMCWDYGDLPETYQTTSSAGGPAHKIGTLHLGALIDGEQDGQPDGAAIGDDVTEKNDDDGITRDANEEWIAGGTGHITATLSGPGYLVAWIDWNRNGIFDLPDEMIDFGSLPGGVNNLEIPVPGDYIEGETLFIRFRLYAGVPSVILPTGMVEDGEVEDYIWHFQITAVELSSFSAWAEASRAAVAWQSPSEIDVAGYYLWRSAGGAYMRITREMIPVEPTLGLFSDYSYRDASVLTGVTYSYKLERVYTSGTSDFYGPELVVMPKAYSQLYMPLINK